VASNGPKTIEMTGEVADGWLPLGVSTKFYKVGIDKITEVLQKEGRDKSNFTFGVFNRVFINDDDQKIEEQVRGVKMAMVMQPLVIKELGYWKDGFDELFCEATGYKCEEISLLQVDRDDIVKFDLNKLSTIIDEVPDEVVRNNIMFGTKEEIIDKIQKYVDLGAQYFVLEIQNGASSKNAPYTYWDVSQILSNDIIPLFKD
jgi:alkanesulfonate monooxygenase SsuD/methylene tetrahydromethanopterin reductase-like flavin-dependent oxidoreductase (luciferase family)